jgi:hypothetical protein
MERAVTKIGTIAAALLLSVGAFASMPAAASEPTTEAPAWQTAATACFSFNEYGPVEVVQAVEDGLGDWIVWVRDKDNDLWLCNVSSEGNIYANSLIRGDLLAGRGEEAIALTQVAHTSRIAAADKAERVCAAAGRRFEATDIVATVEDGVGDYVVWLKASDGSYWLCNASAKAELYVFERVHAPLNTPPVDPNFRSA